MKQLRAKKATEKSSNIECNTMKNPGEQNNWGQAENPGMSMPRAEPHQPPQEPFLQQCSSHHLLVLCQEVGGSQAEGSHHAAVEATGEDPLGGVEGHGTWCLISSREVVELQGKHSMGTKLEGAEWPQSSTTVVS